MGLFWDLIQQGQIGAHKAHAATLESRIERLENDIEQVQQLLMALLDRLEKHFGEDLDRDGQIG
jgi:hypothetical protein